MSSGRAQQFQTVSLGLGQGLLMAKNYFGRIVLNLPESNESPTLQLFFSPGSPEILHITIDRWLGILPQNAVSSPLTKEPSGPRVNAIYRAIRGLPLSQNDTDDTGGTRCIVAFLHVRCDLVVRLRNDLGKLNPPRVVTPGAEGGNVSHNVNTALY